MGYLRLFGSKGRSIGQYDQSFLHDDILPRVGEHHAFVVFGQGDVPMQALHNAKQLKLLSRSADPTSQTCVAEEAIPHFDPVEVSGQVKWFNERDGHLHILLSDGRDAILGARHVGSMDLNANLSQGKRRRMRFRTGAPIKGLRVEAVDPTTGRIYLCAADAGGSSNRQSNSYGSAKGVPGSPPHSFQTGDDDAADSSSSGSSHGSEELSGDGEEGGGDGGSSVDSEGNDQQLEVHCLPKPDVLGASRDRVLNIITWGNGRCAQPPPADAYITCNYKKFHYLTRNNKHIKRSNGLDEAVQGRICRNGFTESWLRDTIGRIEHDDLHNVAFHCWKGTHLSVAIAEILRKFYYPRATVQHSSLAYIRPGRKGGPAKH